LLAIKMELVTTINGSNYFNAIRSLKIWIKLFGLFFCLKEKFKIRGYQNDLISLTFVERSYLEVAVLFLELN